MSRWHRPDCLDPRVEIADGSPKCNSCDQAPSLAELIGDFQKKHCGLSLPPDEPPGSLSLWWPRSVPYGSSAGRVTPLHHLGADFPKNKGPQDSSGQTSHSLPASSIKCKPTMSIIYGARIQPNDFRLMVVSGEESHDSPVHVDLEVYRLDDHPEYETISYTWGGEDNDSTPCQPIYVGPYWDILFQTKNCWEMLRFIRPHRGIRVVWVDAVCINQNDVLEQSSQVANMGRIYSGCTRVNVYLGPDIAIRLHNKHPRRHPLHELACGTVMPEFPGCTSPSKGVTLAALVKRRYFSRLWVIQELVLSCNILMRVGDIDFWADALLPTHLCKHFPDWTWDALAAPWLRYLAQGSFMGNSVWDLLTMTSKSQSADPRDRVFGLLGVFALGKHKPDTPDPLLQMAPNYSISCQHVFIGLFACWLLVHKSPSVLFAAPISVRPVGYPSWAPDWKSPDVWRAGLEIPQISCSRAVEYITSKHFDDSLAHRPCQVKMHHLLGSSVLPARSWESDAFVCSATGALHVRLTKLFSLKAKPIRMSDETVLLSETDRYHVFVLGRYTQCPVYIFSEYLLDQLTTGDEQVFVLQMGQDPLIYIILRPSATDEGSFQFVAAVPLLCITHVQEVDDVLSNDERPVTPDERQLPGDESSHFHGDWTFESRVKYASTSNKHLATITKEVTVKHENLELKDLQSSLYKHLQDIAALLDEERAAGASDNGVFYAAGLGGPDLRNLDQGLHTLMWSFFPHAKCLRDLLGPYLSLFFSRKTGSDNTLHTFQNAYLDCVQQHCEAKIEDGVLFLVLDAQSWSENLWRYFVPEYTRRQSVWRVRRPGETRWFCINHGLAKTQEWNAGHDGGVMDDSDWKNIYCSSGCVELRHRFSDLIDHFADASRQFRQLWSSLEILERVSADTGEDMYSLLQREPREEDHQVYCVRWSENPSMLNDFSVRDGLGMTGLESTVRIM